jgi:predicted O-methyltransferase YrrM
MTRIEVIQRIIDKKRAKNYLEIGVFAGACFLKIKAKRKFAVDPDFRIPWEVRADNLTKKINRRIFEKFELYYKCYSDDFFNEQGAILNRYPLDVVFIDGLHTYAQSLKDVENALKFLKDDGVIILHDCNPESDVIAYPAESLSYVESLNLPGFTGTWCGDVWKTIALLKATRDDLTVFVLNTDLGLGIVQKKKSAKTNFFKPADIKYLDYKELAANRDAILDLKPVSYFNEFLATL